MMGPLLVPLEIKGSRALEGPTSPSKHWKKQDSVKLVWDKKGKGLRSIITLRPLGYLSLSLGNGLLDPWDTPGICLKNRPNPWDIFKIHPLQSQPEMIVCVV